MRAGSSRRRRPRRRSRTHCTTRRACGFAHRRSMPSAFARRSRDRCRPIPRKGAATRVARRAGALAGRRRCGRVVGGLIGQPARSCRAASIAPVVPGGADGAMWSAATLERAAVAARCAAPGGATNAGSRSIRRSARSTTNLTPDPDTGIGTWSYPAFARAMREGISRDGTHLYPAFPYTAFAKLSEPDLLALYAYLMSQPPVKHVPPTTKLPFPLDQRRLVAGWNCFTMRGRSRRTRHAPRRGIAASIWSTVPGTAAHAIRRATRWVRRRAVWRTCRVVRQRVGSRRRSSRRRLRRCRGPKARCSITCVRASPRSMASRPGRWRPSSRRVAARGRRPGDRALSRVVVAARRRSGRRRRGRPAGARRGSRRDARPRERPPCVRRRVCGLSCGIGRRRAFRRTPADANTSVSQAAPDNLLRVLHHGIDQPATGELGYMPGFGDAFDDRQMAELAAYIRARYAPGSRRGGTWRRRQHESARKLHTDRPPGNGQRATGCGRRQPGNRAKLPADAIWPGTGAEILPHFHHRLTIRNNVFTERGMISGDRAGILSPMLLNARRTARACHVHSSFLSNLAMFDRRGCRMLARRVFDRFRRDRDVEPERVYRDDAHGRRVDDVGRCPYEGRRRSHQLLHAARRAREHEAGIADQRQPCRRTLRTRVRVPSDLRDGVEPARLSDRRR